MRKNFVSLFLTPFRVISRRSVHLTGVSGYPTCTNKLLRKLLIARDERQTSFRLCRRSNWQQALMFRWPANPPSKQFLIIHHLANSAFFDLKIYEVLLVVYCCGRFPIDERFSIVPVDLLPTSSKYC